MMRKPVALRDIMIMPVRTGYIGDHPIDPKELPPSAAELYPEILVSEILVPSRMGPVRCQVYAPAAASHALPMLMYLHGGGFTVGRSEDTAYITSSAGLREQTRGRERQLPARPGVAISGRHR